MPGDGGWDTRNGGFFGFQNLGFLPQKLEFRDEETTNNLTFLSFSGKRKANEIDLQLGMVMDDSTRTHFWSIGNGLLLLWFVVGFITKASFC